MIVTTRIHGYATGSDLPESFRNAGFKQFTLQDFREEEIDRFLPLWHQEAFSDLADRIRYENRIRKALKDSLAIHELATNPLLLTLMAILSRNRFTRGSWQAL
jgi:predicted NACHT family NTPase